MFDSGSAEILIENLDGTWELRKYTSFNTVRQVWERLELDTEGEPGPDDIVLEEMPGTDLEWVAFHWQDCDTPVITGFHSMEEILPVAFRWMEAHSIEPTFHVWIKEGGVFSLLELS